MIRIMTYKEHLKGKAILDRYLYLVAYMLPFPPEDVLGNNVLDVDGQIITAKNFFQKSKKKSRKRTNEYKEMMKNYKIEYISESKEEKLNQDYLLAAKLIWSASRGLYAYLYKTDNREEEPINLPLVRRENLRTLLIGKMDELPVELKDVGRIGAERGKKLLKEVFRYDSFSCNTHALKLLEDMDVNVCPYCNRLYTMTLTKSGKSRPQFDHYKSKSQYPYLSVSLMNLIPSCALCNQSKGGKNEEVLYPYSDEMGMNALFRTKIETGVNYLIGIQGTQDEFNVGLEIADDLPKELRDKIQRSDEFFNLTGLYNKHKDYILYLFWKNHVFSDTYLKELQEKFPNIFHSFENVKRMMYLMDIDQAQWGSRPLGKLTHDIDMEINEIN